MKNESPNEIVKLIKHCFSREIKDINSLSDEEIFCDLIAVRSSKIVAKEWDYNSELIFNTILNQSSEMKIILNDFQQDFPNLKKESLHTDILKKSIDEIISNVKTKKDISYR